MTFIEVSSASVVILKEMFDKFLKGTSTVSKKRCSEKYCSCDLQGTPRRVFRKSDN